MSKKILMVAGEASGDLHCGRLASKLKELSPSLQMFGMGGKYMSEGGVQIVYDISDISVIGITEVLSRLSKLIKRLKDIKNLIRQTKPDLIILVDFPDFNVRLLPFAHKLNIPVIYYIPPKAWAWRKSRAKALARYTRIVASILPFETQVYKKAGANVVYVGHPLLDYARPTMTKQECYQKFQLDAESPVIGLMPGSRKREIDKLLPILVRSAKIIKSKVPDCQFILPVAHTIPREMINVSDIAISIVGADDVYNMMSISDLIIMASGTASLEATIILTPMIVIYKVSPISWLIMRSLVNPNIRSTVLPNLVAGKNIVPELLQSKADPKHISDVALKLLNNKELLLQQKFQLMSIRDMLGAPGAVERTARLILDTLNA